MTYHSNNESWKSYVKSNIGSAVDLAALLNVTAPTGRTYLKHPTKLTIEQVYVLSIKTETPLKELTTLIVLHDEEK